MQPFNDSTSFAALCRGGLSFVLPLALFNRHTGGSTSARYCYSVFLRHLTLRHQATGKGVPLRFAELGPGDSVGVGLAALLSGAAVYYALDVKPFAPAARNVQVLDALVELFRDRTPIPGPEEFPNLYPRLDSYEFPFSLISEDALQKALDPVRIQRLRQEITRGKGSMFRYVAPWESHHVEQSSLDWILSHAVLEHVENVGKTSRSCSEWLAPGGTVTHQIDYTAHGSAGMWNGHLAYSRVCWKLVRGRRAFFINREPHSGHLKALQNAGFHVLEQRTIHARSTLSERELAAECSHFTADDLTTCGAFIAAMKGR